LINNVSDIWEVLRTDPTKSTILFCYHWSRHHRTCYHHSSKKSL